MITNNIEELRCKMFGIRAKFNLTQRQFSKLCGVSENCISAIETGKDRKFRAITVGKIASTIDKIEAYGSVNNN